MLKSIDRIIEKTGEWILVITGVAVCSIIFINALVRYIFKSDLFGNEEIVLFFAFWLYFTGSALAARKNTHITADMVSLFTHDRKLISVIHFIRDIFSLIMVALATYWSFNYVSWSWEMGARSNVFKLPNVIGQLPIFISFLIWLGYMIRDVLKDLSILRQNKSNEED